MLRLQLRRDTRGDGPHPADHWHQAASRSSRSRSAAGAPTSSGETDNQPRRRAARHRRPASGGTPSVRRVSHRASVLRPDRRRHVSPIPGAAAPSPATRPCGGVGRPVGKPADLLERALFLEAQDDDPPVLLRQPVDRAAQAPAPARARSPRRWARGSIRPAPARFRPRSLGRRTRSRGQSPACPWRGTAA